MHRGALRIALLALLAPATALAQAPLADADRAYDDGRLGEAAHAYDDALATGALDPALLTRAHVRLGVLAALEGEDEATDRHFAIALALDPVRDAPEELTPELRARFDALREARDGHRLTLAIEMEDEGMHLVVRDAPPDLVQTIVVRGGHGWERRFPWSGEPITIDPPPEAMPVEAFALDAHGNRLARAGARIEVPVVLGEPAPLTQPPANGDGGRNLIESPWLWIVVGTIVIGAAVAVGVSASGDRYTLDPPVVR